MQPPKKPTKKEKFQQTQKSHKSSEKTFETPKKKLNLFYVVIAAVAFILYANTLKNDYVLDDFSVIKENNIVNQGSKNIPYIFKTSYRTGYLNVNDGLYRPLSLAMFAIEWSLSPNNPALGHFINILVYILCGIVLFRVLVRILPQWHVNWILAVVLLFMAHPIHTEVVANIKSRDELLCFLFSFQSIYATLNYIDKNKLIYLLGSIIFLFLAFLAKESAILTLPLIICIIWFYRRDSLSKLFGIVTAILIPFAFYMLIRKTVLGTFTGIQNVTMLDNPIGTQSNIGLKLIGSIQVLSDYFKLFLVPHPLIYDYSYNSVPVQNEFSWGALAAVITVVAIVVLLIISYKKHAVLSFSLLSIFISLSLYTNLFITIGAAKAERFTFLASFGFCLALVYVVSRFLKIDLTGFQKGLVSTKNRVIVFLGILVLYSVKTISRNSNWKDNITLYTHDLALNPESAKTHYYLGNEIIKNLADKENDSLKKRALLYQGIKVVEKAVAIFPPYSDGYVQIGVGYFKMNKMDSAAIYFEKGLKYNPDNSVALSNYGAYLFNKGRYAEAIGIYDRTLKLNPRFVDAMVNLGSCYGATQQYDKAIVWFTQAYELDPTNQRTISLLALTYKNMNQLDKASYFQSLMQ